MNIIYALSYLIFLEMKRKFLGTKYFAELDVTDNCNLRCRHCYHFLDKGDNLEKEVPIRVWKKRLENLHRNGIRFVLLVGGEPALRKDVLMLADRLFPFVYVITNGTIKIPGEFDHPLFVSLDGTEKTNDHLRGKGVFSSVMKNYSGDSRAVINMTLDAKNYTELEDVVIAAKKNGLRGVVCNLYTPTLGKNNKFFIKADERKRIITELRRMKKKYPEHFMFTESMIKWYDDCDHRGFCFWGDEALHFDSSWKRRRCFSDKADCSNCGCLAGSFQNLLSLLREPRVMMKFL